MTDRWQQIEKICQSALELEENQRKAFLEEACAGDKDMREEVESLLQFGSRGERSVFVIIPSSRRLHYRRMNVVLGLETLY